MATAKPKEVNAKDTDGEEAPKKKSKMLIFIIIGVLVFLLGGGAGYYFVMMKKDPAQSTEVKKVVEPKDPIYVVLEPFTVNLSGGGQYLQMAITLQMKDDKSGVRIKAYLPSVRSRILLLISSKTAEEITNEEGKLTLKSEIKEAIEKPFAEGASPIEIFEVLITAFVIQ
jgi:flagellar FliL protein